jgi:hypothetical protein
MDGHRHALGRTDIFLTTNDRVCRCAGLLAGQRQVVVENPLHEPWHVTSVGKKLSIHL